MVTVRTPGCAAMRVSTSFLICARSGQPAMVSLTPMVTSPSGVTVAPVVIPRSTMLPPSSGSITARSSPSSSSTVGGAIVPGTAAFYRSPPCNLVLWPSTPGSPAWTC